MKLTSAKRLEGHALGARDGEIGWVKDFYFDDHRWRVRYCVVETGQWLHSRQVLISPEVIGAYNPALQLFPTDLTIEQVRNSPDVETDKPVSRQREEALRNYYNWSPYYFMGEGGVLAPIAAPIPAENSAEPGLADDIPLGSKGDPHLRSTNATLGYRIEALDGTIGHAADFLIDDEDWRIRYLVIDTGNWWPGKKVVVPPTSITRVSWTASEVAVDLDRATIQRAPLYDPRSLGDPAYVVALHDYYGPSRAVEIQGHGQEPATWPRTTTTTVPQASSASRKIVSQRRCPAPELAWTGDGDEAVRL